jgi:hypothetical protein
MERKFPEQQWVVDSIAPAAAITVISGSPGTFKTYTVLDLAMSVASGKKLFGQFATQQSAVLLIDEDNEEALRHRRLNQLGLPSGLPIYFTPSKGFVAEDEMIDDVIRSCKKHDIKLVIIDCLARIHDTDENKSGDMSGVFKKLKRFSENGIAVVMTHHNNKKGATDDSGLSNAMRGSSDIFASVDTHMAVMRKGKHTLRFVQTKQRYAEEIDPFKVVVEVDKVKDSFRFEYEGSLGKEDRAQEKLLALEESIVILLAEHGKLFQGQLLQKLEEMGRKTSEHTLRELLPDMISEGDILESPGPGKTKFYSLAGKEVTED